MIREMNVDEALLIADDFEPRAGVTQSGPAVAALQILAVEVRRQHGEIERLREQLAASLRDSERAASTASKLADQRLVTRVEADAEAKRWLQDMPVAHAPVADLSAEVGRLRGLCRTAEGMLRDAGADDDAATIERMAGGSVGPDDLFADHG